MKAYITQVLVLIAVLIVVYILWGVEIKKFFSDRGVVDIPTLFSFLYALGVWLVEKIFSIVVSIGEYILQIFKNILSNVMRIADLLAGILDILKKISSFLGGIFGSAN